MHALFYIPDPTAIPADEATVATQESEFQSVVMSEYRELRNRFDFLGKTAPEADEMATVARRLDYIESSFLFLDGIVIATPTDTLSL